MRSLKGSDPVATVIPEFAQQMSGTSQSKHRVVTRTVISDFAQQMSGTSQIKHRVVTRTVIPAQAGTSVRFAER